MRLLNRVLWYVGIAVVPRLYSSPKSLHEHANIGESFHPSRGGNTVRWMRDAAEVLR